MEQAVGSVNAAEIAVDREMKRQTSVEETRRKMAKEAREKRAKEIEEHKEKLKKESEERRQALQTLDILSDRLTHVVERRERYSLQTSEPLAKALHAAEVRWRPLNAFLDSPAAATPRSFFSVLHL